MNTEILFFAGAVAIGGLIMATHSYLRAKDNNKEVSRELAKAQDLLKDIAELKPELCKSWEDFDFIVYGQKLDSARIKLAAEYLRHLEADDEAREAFESVQ